MKKKSPIDIYPIKRLPEKACWKATFLDFLEDIFQAISRSKRKYYRQCSKVEEKRQTCRQLLYVMETRKN